jgi:hypothetical protein
MIGWNKLINGLMYVHHFVNTTCKEVKPMPKDSQPDPKHSGSNKDSASADMANQPNHSANYHKAAGDGTITKK